MGLVRPHFPGCFFNVWASGQVVPKLLAERPGITGQAALLVPWPLNLSSWRTLPQGFCWGLCQLVPGPCLLQTQQSAHLAGVGNPAGDPTPAPPDGHWQGLYSPCSCCLMVAVPRLNPSLSPLPACHVVPFGTASSGSCCSGLTTATLFIYFF